MADITIGFTNGNVLKVTLFEDKASYCKSYYFMNDDSDYEIKQLYKKVLKLINRRVIE